MTDAPATVVLVHGAWHGAWCWDKVVVGLEEAGVPVIAVDLPGHGDSTEPPGGLYAHGDWLRARLAEIDGPVVLVGHSYGGAVITEAATGSEHVRRLVYLCALVPDVGEPIGAVLADADPPIESESDLGPALLFHDDQTVTLDPVPATIALYNGCDAADVELALARVGPQHASSFVEGIRSAAWHTIPSTYVVCTGDRAMNPAFQRAMAERTTEVVEWDTGHSPFLSDPQLVVDFLVGLARAAG